MSTIRPKIKDFFSEDCSLLDIHNEFVKAPKLYDYIVALDLYVDEIEREIKDNAELLDLLETIRDGDHGMPDWLWVRIKRTIEKYRK